MATVSFTIPDSILTRVIDAVAYNNGYTEMVYDQDRNQIPNPISKAQWAKNAIKSWVKMNVVSYESIKASDEARQMAIDSANSDITIGD